MSDNSNNFLIIDTSFGLCRVILARHGIISSSRVETKMHKQSEVLIPLIDEVLSESSVGWSDISRIIVSNGPGSFTGTRVGLATVSGIKTISMLQDAEIAVSTISTLEMVAASISTKMGVEWFQNEDEGGISRQFYVALPAGRSQFYVQSFLADLSSYAWTPTLSEIELFSQAKLDEMILCKDKKVFVYSDEEQIDLVGVTVYCWKKYFSFDNLGTSMPLTPLYIKGADVYT